MSSDTNKKGEDDRVQSLTMPIFSKGIQPDYTAPSIFFHAVTSHTFGSAGFSISFEAHRATESVDGVCVNDRVYSGIVRCGSLDSLRLLKASVDFLVFAAEKGSGGEAPN